MSKFVKALIAVLVLGFLLCSHNILRNAKMISDLTSMIGDLTQISAELAERVVKLETQKSTIEIYVEKYFNHDEGQDEYRVVDVKEIPQDGDSN